MEEQYLPAKNDLTKIVKTLYLDKDFLSELIQPLLGSKEFFINKAIGWVLREYSKTNSQWVLEFSSKTELSPLSQREALRLIK